MIHFSLKWRLAGNQQNYTRGYVFVINDKLFPVPSLSNLADLLDLPNLRDFSRTVNTTYKFITTECG
jgi:hypothetical protein